MLKSSGLHTHTLHAFPKWRSDSAIGASQQRGGRRGGSPTAFRTRTAPGRRERRSPMVDMWSASEYHCTSSNTNVKRDFSKKQGGVDNRNINPQCLSRWWQRPFAKVLLRAPFYRHASSSPIPVCIVKRILAAQLSTKGTFLWQPVTMGRFLPGYAAWFVSDVTCRAGCSRLLTVSPYCSSPQLLRADCFLYASKYG